MRSRFPSTAQTAITLLISALFVSACSSSSDTSTAPDEQPTLPASDGDSAMDGDDQGNMLEPTNDGTVDSPTDASTDSAADNGSDELNNAMPGTTDNDGSNSPSELDTEPDGDTATLNEVPLGSVTASYEFVADKTFRISWEPEQGAQFYRVLENTDGLSGFSQISDDIDASTRVFNHRVALYKRVNARYIVQACNTNGCIDSEELIVSGSIAGAIGYFKASNTGAGDHFGISIALNSNGTVMAISAKREDSAATGVNGDQSDDSVADPGAVYIFARSNVIGDTPQQWQQQAYLKASNPGYMDLFGTAISLSADGNTLAVSAEGEASAATGINGDQSDNTAGKSGAVYVFTNNNGDWQQQAYLKSSNVAESDEFGTDINLSGDGNTLVVSATGEDGSIPGINGDQNDNNATVAGAVYVFERLSGNWQQEAYLKASNPEPNDRFGSAVDLSSDGNTLAVGAMGEGSGATGVNGDQNNNDERSSGAVYLFERNNAANGASGNWQQQAYLKSGNPDIGDNFGERLSLSANGTTLAVVSRGEHGLAVGINGFQDEEGPEVLRNYGAVYVFEKSNNAWQQQAFIKSTIVDNTDEFGSSLSLSGDGNTLVVGAMHEDSAAQGINGDQFNEEAEGSGAAYVYERRSGNWQHQAFLKASNTARRAGFGVFTELSSDGNTLAIGALLESNQATGVNGNQNEGPIANSGAVYLY